jgi:cell division control protein 6
MEFTFTGDPTAIMDRIIISTRLKSTDTEKELLQSVVNAQLDDFYEK